MIHRFFEHFPLRAVFAGLAGVLIGALAGVTSQTINRTPYIGPESMSYGIQSLRYATKSQMIDGAVVFIGDSQTVALPTSRFPGPTENFGIGSDTVVGALSRTRQYRLEKARAVVLQIGGNDLPTKDLVTFAHNYRALLDAIPAHVPIVAVAAFPGPERGVPEINQIIRQGCATRSKCHFLSINNRLSDKDGNIRREFVTDDGIHLSSAGYAVWIAEMTPLLE